MRRLFLFSVCTLVLSLVAAPLADAAKDCVPFLDARIRRVDMHRVRDAWLQWQNAERKAQGLKPLVYNPQLNRTATLWSIDAAKNKAITHKRSTSAGYYEYGTIEAWFADLGLTFTNANRSTFSESIGYGSYACKAGDCTTKLTDAIRTTFDFYMREKGKPSSPHYNAIVRPEFTQVGMGLALRDGTYYITTHYSTELVDDPLPLCRMRNRLQ